MIVGSKRELVLVRNIDFGGKVLLETLQSLSGETPEMILDALKQDEEIMVENARMSIANVTREVSSSIGFFEGRREEPISQVWVSGGIANNPTMLRLLSEEVNLPCNAWNAIERCETNIPSGKRAVFPEESLQLNTACGAAVELLNS
jgi:Tfp pilus assembly PilM family ATPase